MIDFEPSDEQALIVETVRQFAENEIRPLSREADEAGKPPAALLDAAHQLGLVANGLPEAQGGGGDRSAVTGVLIAEELGWGDMALALSILSPGLVGFPVADHGNEHHQKQVLTGLLGDRFVPGSLAITEPRFDFDVYHPQTTAKRDGDQIILDGSKCQVPWLEGGQHVVVIASDEQGLAAFLVERDAQGLTAEPELKLGIEGLPTAQLEFSSVRVPAEARLDAGDAEIRNLIVRGQVALAAVAVGTARAAFELARDYAKQRETFGQPIATRQAIAFKIADMTIEIDGARLLIWEAAVALDKGQDATRLARLAYDQTTRISLIVADGAVQVFGGHGYIRDYLPELHLRNLAGMASFNTLALV
jgi:alkylation response protein AidB-like acyl-CoA dehydrogenase